jgi:hypothetical protein
MPLQGSGFGFRARLCTVEGTPVWMLYLYDQAFMDGKIACVAKYPPSVPFDPNSNNRKYAGGYHVSIMVGVLPTIHMKSGSMCLRKMPL